jgi:hypothetical protein
MSQLSQFSDIYPSSIYDGDPVNLADNLLCFPTEQFPTPELSGSQQTLESASNSGSLTPIPLPLIPSSLQRVGPGRSLAFVLYSDMSKDDFVA